jgi:outer membrane protein
MKRTIIILAFFLPLLAFGQQHVPLTLEQSITIALENNYGIIVGNKNLEISQANNTWGAVGVLPSISLSGSGSRNDNYNDMDDFTTDSYSSNVNLNWVLFRGFGAKIDKAKLDEYEEMSKGNLAVIVENTISNVILSYYDVLLQKENVQVAEKLMSLSKDRYDSEKLKTEIGSSVTYNLLQAKNSYLEDKSNYLAAKSNYNNAVRQLNFLMAEPLDKTYNCLTAFQADTSSFVEQDLMDQLKANNNTLKNQYINLELTKLNIDAARSSIWPTISLGASGGYSNSETKYDINSLMNYESKGYNAGLSLGVSFSLFDGGKKRQAVQVAKLEEETAQVEIEEMTAELENQLSQEFELYEVRKEMLKLADENMEAAELNLKISEQKFESGAINSFNFRDVQQIYSNAALSQLNATFNVIQSYHSLLRLTGGLIGEYR